MSTPSAESLLQAIERKLEAMRKRDDGVSKFAIDVLSSIEDTARELDRNRKDWNWNTRQPSPADDAVRQFSAWAFLRGVLEQGRSIQMDNAAGNYPTYEHMSARIDEAARDRADELEAALAADNQTTRS